MTYTINQAVDVNAAVDIDNIQLNGNTISSTDTNGHIVLSPNGSGNVGIGTTNPQGNLHISGGAGNCVMILDADTDNDNNEIGNPAIWFKQDGGITGSSISMDNNRLVFNNNVSNSGGFAFYTGTTNNTGTTSPLTGATEKMTITPGGDVGIGTSSPQAGLHVATRDSGTLTSASRSFFYNTYTSLGQNTGTWTDIGIYALWSIVSSEYIVSHGSETFSDRRIKDNIVDVEDDICLQKLRLIKPKQYTYQDTVAKGTEPVWGFIAQEVAETLDYAVDKMKKAIPNVYKLASVSEDGLVLTFEEPITLETMDTIKLQLKTLVSDEYDVTISEVLSPTTICLTEPLTEDHHTGTLREESIVRKVFVYGQWVDDFHVLKKDAIFTVAVAALQEVDRRQTDDNERILELEGEVETLKAQVAALLQHTGVTV